MRVRTLLGCLLALAVVVFLAWGLPDGEAPDVAPDSERETASAGVTLSVQGHAPPDAAAPAEKPQRLPDGRRWTLEVQYAQHAGRWGSYAEWSAGGVEESPFAGERVRVELRRGSEVAVLARGTLDERGTARFDLPALARLDRLARVASTLHVAPESKDVVLAPVPVFQFGPANVRTHSYALPADPPAGDVTLRLIVTALKGGLVRGRAVRADGTPAVSVHVWFYGYQGATATDACTDEDGRFAVHVSTGGKFNFYVTALDGASSGQFNVELPANLDLDLGTIRLKEEGAFSGVITYPDGAPVAHLPVRAGHYFKNMHVNYGPRMLPCQGHGNDRSALTDAQGRFRLFPSGPPGPNDMWSVMHWFEGDALVTDAAHGTSHPQKLRSDLDGVMQGHGLTLRAHDAAGKPVPRVRITLRALEREGKHKRGETVKVETGDDGEARAWLSRGSTWSLHAVADGGIAASRDVRIPKDKNESTVTVELRSPDENTGLTVSIQDPEGRALAPFLLTLRTPQGVRLWRGRSDTPRSPPLLLHPGIYEVVAEPREQAPWAPTVQRWLRTTRRVEVESGSIKTVTLATAEAAHLAVTLQLAPEVDRLRGPHHPRVHLEHAESGRTLSEFVRQGYAAPADVLSEGLEPGLWTVRFDAREYRSVTRKVTLERGAVARVEFVMERDD